MIKPLGYRVLVKPDKVEKTYGESKIIIAMDEKLEKGGIQKGLLVDVGEAITIEAEPGDYVYFARYAGKFVQDPADPETEYMIMNDTDILGIITDEIPNYIESEIRKKLTNQEEVDNV